MGSLVSSSFSAIVCSVLVVLARAASACRRDFDVANDEDPSLTSTACRASSPCFVRRASFSSSVVVGGSTCCAAGMNYACRESMTSVANSASFVILDFTVSSRVQRLPVGFAFWNTSSSTGRAGGAAAGALRLSTAAAALAAALSLGWALVAVYAPCEGAVAAALAAFACLCLSLLAARFCAGVSRGAPAPGIGGGRCCS